MRISIEKGFQPLVTDVMQQIKTDDPKLAVNHIIGSWAAGQQGSALQQSSEQQQETVDEFSDVATWD